MNQIACAKALAFTIGSGQGRNLGEEGGFVDNPHDHGGRTNRGITQASYDRFRIQLGLQPADVKDVPEAMVTQFYQALWVSAHCDDMSLGLAVSHFDWTVNHGLGRYHVAGSLETLQETLQIQVDGVYGPATRAALLAQDHDDLWREYNKLRHDWYVARVQSHPDQAEFLKDWLGRVDRLDAYVETL